MTALTTRDKWLAAALPALITLLGGWIFVARPAARELATLRLRVENQGALSTRLAMAERAQLERGELEKLLNDSRNAVPEADGVFDRNLAMQQVSVLCTTHGLSLRATSPEPNGKLSPAFQEAAAALLRLPNATEPKVWRIELSGSYPGVLKLLRDLQKSKSIIVPLNLSMEASDDGRNPANWILTLWF